MLCIVVRGLSEVSGLWLEMDLTDRILAVDLTLKSGEKPRLVPYGAGCWLPCERKTPLSGMRSFEGAFDFMDVGTSVVAA